MKISTLAAAALFGAGLSFMAPSADAVPIASTQAANTVAQAVTTDMLAEHTTIISLSLMSSSTAKPSI